MNLSTFDAFKRLKTSDAVELDLKDVQRLQQTVLGIFDDVASCCERRGFTCLAAGGTALGALRRGGFIAWDDDIDVIMPRRDFESFAKAFAAELGGKYWLHAPSVTKGYSLAMARVRLRGTSVRMREDLADGQQECGAFVDIFIMENTFDNALLRTLHGVGSMALGFLYSCRKLFHERRLVKRLTRANGGVPMSFRVKTAVGFLLAVIPLGFWVSLWDWWNAICRDSGSRYVTVPVGRRHFFGELAPRHEMEGVRKLRFEGRTVKCPAGLENYMTRLYGPGYMTPPPEGERERHVVFRPFFLDRSDAELQVVVATHKDYAMPADAVYLPVFVGAALAGGAAVPAGFRRDDEGENISARNRSWCELTALYWAWKNVKSAAVGLVHYRRHFRGRGGAASGAEICAALETADAILPKERNYFIETTYSQYVHAHHAEDLDLTRRILEERHPGFVAAFDAVMKSTRGHRFNMMVMKRPLFDDYCAWLFDVLFELERRLDISSYSDYDKRVFGFVAERLLDVYVRAKGVRCAEMPVLHLESQHWPRKIAAFLRRKLSSGTRK